jgi:hypothetical protein
MDEWLVGGALALIGIAYVVWDVRNSLKPRRDYSEGGSDGSDSDSSADSSGGDGDGD